MATEFMKGKKYLVSLWSVGFVSVLNLWSAAVKCLIGASSSKAWWQCEHMAENKETLFFEKWNCPNVGDDCNALHSTNLLFWNSCKCMLWCFLNCGKLLAQILTYLRLNKKSAGQCLCRQSNVSSSRLEFFFCIWELKALMVLKKKKRKDVL